mmetsp:Transcript_13634/g.21784  ORF Transcript_13634/g.21784 Transcript_13634/m.21784 type:complete len:227 (-) Transcript_13634:63-743(-)
MLSLISGELLRWLASFSPPPSSRLSLAFVFSPVFGQFTHDAGQRKRFDFESNPVSILSAVLPECSTAGGILPVNSSNSCGWVLKSPARITLSPFLMWIGHSRFIVASSPARTSPGKTTFPDLSRDVVMRWAATIQTAFFECLCVSLTIPQLRLSSRFIIVAPPSLFVLLLTLCQCSRKSKLRAEGSLPSGKYPSTDSVRQSFLKSDVKTFLSHHVESPPPPAGLTK